MRALVCCQCASLCRHQAAGGDGGADAVGGEGVQLFDFRRGLVAAIVTGGAERVVDLLAFRDRRDGEDAALWCGGRRAVVVVAGAVAAGSVGGAVDVQAAIANAEAASQTCERFIVSPSGCRVLLR